MRRDPKCFLWDIQQAAEAILDYVSGKSFEDYTQQRMLRSAVEREFVVIGEATNRLANHDEQLAINITNYRKIISLRNIIAHEYDDIRNDLIWAVITNDLQILHHEVTNLLSN